MYRLQQGVSIDIDAECQAVVDLLKLHCSIWNPEALVAVIHRKAECDGRNWLNQVYLSKYFVDQLQKRFTVLQHGVKERPLSVDFDFYFQFFMTATCVSADFCTAAVEVQEKWDFSKQVKILHRELLNSFPEFSSVKPNGWPTNSDVPDLNLFTGADTGIRRLPNQLTTENVKLDVEQGLSVSESITSSIYGHFLGIKLHCNSERFLAAMECLNFPVGNFEPVFSCKKPEVGHQYPLLQAFLDVCFASIPENLQAAYEASKASASQQRGNDPVSKESILSSLRAHSIS